MKYTEAELRKKIESEKLDDEYRLINEYVESETFEEFSLRVSTKYGYSRHKLLNPFWWVVFMNNNQKVFNFISWSLVFVISFTSFLVSKCMIGRMIYGLAPFFVFIAVLWHIDSIISCLNIRIKTSQEWFDKFKEHFHKVD